MKLGIISDTHVYDRAKCLPKKVLDVLLKEEVDLVIHAGDLTSTKILEELESIAEVIAVRGNMDELQLPEQQKIKIGNFNFLIFHGHGIYPRGDITKLVYKTLEEKCNVLITGHTHRPSILEINGIRIINPGSPTVPRYDKPTFMISEIKEDRIITKIVEV